VPPTYDSLVAKLIVHADTREEAIMRMKRALEEMVVSGIKTTIPLHQRLMDEPDFRSGDYSIKWLEALLAKGGRS
jgi:acetyl-CoA carboxylase biotin carboxylase subunit